MAKGRSSVTDRDHGARALMRRVGQAGSLTVGLHQSEGSQAKQDGDGETVLDIGLIHEFGSEAAGIPARSFIRDWEAEEADRHADRMRASGKAIIAGKLDTETAMKRLGVLYQGEVQKRISDGIDPPLAQVTIDRKGSSKPLIDTGQLRSNISHEVKVTKS